MRFPNDDWQQVFAATPSLLAEQLRMVARGEVAQLLIQGGLHEPRLGRQPSVVASIRLGDPLGGSTPVFFWNATPSVPRAAP